MEQFGNLYEFDDLRVHGEQILLQKHLHAQISSSFAAFEYWEVVDTLNKTVEVQLRGGLWQLELGAQLLSLFVSMIIELFHLIRNVLGVKDAKESKDNMVGETTVKAFSEFLEVVLY